jgi:hypothetical protein
MSKVRTDPYPELLSTEVFAPISPAWDRTRNRSARIFSCWPPRPCDRARWSSFGPGGFDGRLATRNCHSKDAGV